MKNFFIKLFALFAVMGLLATQASAALTAPDFTGASADVTTEIGRAHV